LYLEILRPSRCKISHKRAFGNYLVKLTKKFSVS
jgi:hypothetical protein